MDRQNPLTLSVIIPCYNEEKTIERLLERVCQVELHGVSKEILVVDDGSTDASVQKVKHLMTRYPEIRLIQKPNGGKGSAVKQGLSQAQGDIIVTQDADLEYYPEDWHKMISLFQNPEVAVVFGSRRMLPENPTSGFFYYWGAQTINFFTNVLYNQRVSDQFTCYKMMRRSVLKDIPLHSNRFEIDAELMAKLFRRGHHVHEVPIRYAPRTKQEGKKIRFRDGIAWLWQIVKHRFTTPERW